MRGERPPPQNTYENYIFLVLSGGSQAAGTEAAQNGQLWREFNASANTQVHTGNNLRVENYY